MINHTLRTLIVLTKAKITLFVSVTAIAGYLLCSGRWDNGILIMALGLFLLASGSAAFNEYQERASDALMPRTRERPIPSGDISPETASMVATVLIVAGLLVLLYGVNFRAFLLGGLAVFWYNGVYLFLKRRTAFAVVPGSLVGAFGPLIGWAAAGGAFDDRRIWALAFFFFIWQIPHFWLLLLRYGREYEGAGYPSLSTCFGESEIRRLIFIWMVAMAVASLAIPLTGGVLSRSGLAILVFASIWIVERGFRLWRSGDDPRAFRRTFIAINIYALILSALVSVDAVIMGAMGEL